jgi:putative membrane protein
MMRVFLAGTAAVLLSVAPAFAQKTTPATTKTAGQAAADHQFAMKAAQGGLAEVELGRLATEKASSDEVKKFGQRMVDDHSKANDELKSEAQKKNITLPSSVDAKDKALMDRLSKLSGAAFDRAYMSAMVKDHRTDVAEFQNEASNGHDADLKAWAAKTLPTLQDHLKQAESVDQAVGTSGVKK